MILNGKKSVKVTLIIVCILLSIIGIIFTSKTFVHKGTFSINDEIHDDEFDRWLDESAGTWLDINGYCRQHNGGNDFYLDELCYSDGINYSESNARCSGDYRNIKFDVYTIYGYDPVLSGGPVGLSGTDVTPYTYSIKSTYRISQKDNYNCVLCDGETSLSNECKNKIASYGNLNWYKPKVIESSTEVILENKYTTPIIQINPENTHSTEEIYNYVVNSNNSEDYHQIANIINPGVYDADSENKVYKPTTIRNCRRNLKYDETEQILVTNEDPVGYTYDITRGTNAGDYKITALLKPGFKWQDGDSSSTSEFTCRIKRGIYETQSSKIYIEDNDSGFKIGSHNYKGTYTLSSDNPEIIDISPNNTDSVFNTQVTTTAFADGCANITIIFTPDNTDYSIVNKQIEICKHSEDDIPVDAPTSNSFYNNLKYNGSQQVLVKDENPTGYSYNITKGKNTGKYNIIATLKPGYRWKGSLIQSSSKEFEINIEKFWLGSLEYVKLSQKNIIVNKGSQITISEIPYANDVKSIIINSIIDKSIASVSSDFNVIPAGGKNEITIYGNEVGCTLFHPILILEDETNYDDGAGNGYRICVHDPNASINPVDKPNSIHNCVADLRYNGEEQTLVTDAIGYDYNFTKGKDPGVYTITATIKPGYKWYDDDPSPTVDFNCYIYNDNSASIPKTVPKPTTDTVCVDNLTYNLYDQNLVKYKNYNYNYDLTKAKDVGEHEIVATLNEGYTWNDGDTSRTASFTCKINDVVKTNLTITVKNWLASDNSSDDKFIVKGLREGDTIAEKQYQFDYENDKININYVIIKDAYGNDVTDFYNLTYVSGNILYLEVNNNLTLDTDKKIIGNILAETTYDKVLENITPNENITLKSKNGNSLNNDDKVKSGDIILVKDKEYRISVLGDVNGDGKVSVTDVAKLFQHVQKTNIISEGESYYSMAGDVTNDNEVKLNDVAKLYQYVSKTISSLN